jgi:hypothetical protein
MTFHPTSKDVRNGYIPMIIVRNEKGQCIGSATCKTRVFMSRPFAESVAHAAALVAAAKLNAKVV